MDKQEAYEDIIDDIEGLDLVQDTHIGENYLYVESVLECSAEEFREDISVWLFDREEEYSLEIRTKKNKDGLVAIVGTEVEHPVQKSTMYCGKLGLSDRYTYQIQLKTTNLVDDDVYDGDNPNAFALAVIQVLSTAFDFGPYDPDELSSKFDISKKELADKVPTIIDAIEKE